MKVSKIKGALRAFFSACLVALTVCAFAATPALAASFEENKASATDITLNKTESLAFTFLEDQWRHIRLTQNGIVQFTVAVPSPTGLELACGLDLYNSAGEMVWQSPGFTIGGDVESRQFTGVPLASGDYYVELSSNTGFSGTAHLNLRADFTSTTNWETENNDTLELADVLPLNTTFYGELGSSIQDWYTFTIPQRGTVQLTLGPTEGKTYMDVYLSGSKGSLYSTDFSSADGTVKSERIGLESGTYAIRLVASASGMWNTNPAGYSIRVDYAQTSDWEIEPNNSRESAQPISIGKTVSGSCTSIVDRDFFEFTLSKGAQVTFSLTNITTPGRNESISVENSFGKSIGTYRFRDQTVTDPVALEPGTYIVSVDAPAGTEYTFAVRDAAASARTMYRLYNEWSGEHLYTADASERDGLVKLGWTYEGEGWTAPASGEAVYRLYNPYAPMGDHHYTMSKTEYDTLVRAGWRGEGVAWYSAPKTGTPLYRLFNRFAESCTHHYTTSAEERDSLVKIGWTDEGIAWYGL